MKHASLFDTQCKKGENTQGVYLAVAKYEQGEVVHIKVRAKIRRKTEESDKFRDYEAEKVLVKQPGSQDVKSSRFLVIKVSGSSLDREMSTDSIPITPQDTVTSTAAIQLKSHDESAKSSPSQSLSMASQCSSEDETTDYSPDDEAPELPFKDEQRIHVTELSHPPTKRKPPKSPNPPSFAGKQHPVRTNLYSKLRYLTKATGAAVKISDTGEHWNAGSPKGIKVKGMTTSNATVLHRGEFGSVFQVSIWVLL